MTIRRIALMFAVLALVAAACSSSDDGADTTTTAAAAAETTTTAAAAAETTTTAATAAETTTTAAATESAESAVVIGLQLEPPTLDLTESPAAAIPQVLLYNVYEGLVKLDADGQIQPLLAESWELSDDGAEYTFHLVDATFHNGKPLTADDVVFSLNNVLTKDPEHPFKGTLAAIESVEAVDDKTVTVTLSQFSANLLFFLTQGQGVILDEASIGEIATHPVGTGPFAFESQVPGDSIMLVKYPDYWGTPALLETVTYRYINDPNALNNAMLAGDIDVLNGVSAPELLEAFADESQFTVYTGLTNGEVTLAINAGNAPLDQLEVRQAISHGIDRQAVVDGAYFGYGELIGSHTTPLDPYYVDLNEVYPYDPDAAAALLAEAGVEPGTPLRMILPPVSYAERGGQIIASQLTELGFEVDIQNVEWGVWLEDVFANQDYDLSIVAHVEPRDISQYGNPDYYWAYDNPEVAALVAAADAEPDDAARNAIYVQIQEQITADAANVWPFLLPALSVTKPGVTGFIANAPGLSLDITQLAFNP